MFADAKPRRDVGIAKPVAGAEHEDIALEWRQSSSRPFHAPDLRRLARIAERRPCHGCLSGTPRMWGMPQLTQPGATAMGT